MKKRQAKKIMRWTMLCTVVDDNGSERGHDFLSTYSRGDCIRAMKRLGEKVDGIKWYKEDEDE